MVACVLDEVMALPCWKQIGEVSAKLESLPEVIAAWIGGSLVTEKAEKTVREFSTRPQRF